LHPSSETRASDACGVAVGEGIIDDVVAHTTPSRTGALAMMDPT
jgi:hypothetical protein